MTAFRISPSSLTGSIGIPPSKSHTLRAILFASMANGKSEIYQFLHSPDVNAMMQAMRQWGAKIEVFSDRLAITGLNGKLSAASDVIDAGNAGQVLRFVGALAGLAPTYTVITGDHSIRYQRPIKPLLDAMTQLGAHAVSSRLDGFAPIIVKGPLMPGHARLSGEDSQPVSALLIAASFLQGTTTLEVANPGEKPWIDLTLFWLKRLGVAITHCDYSLYTIQGKSGIDGFSFTVPGDFSSAAFSLAAALITGSALTLSNIDREDCQGDKKVIDVLISMGAQISYDNERKTLSVSSGSRLKGRKIDANDFIDAVPILAVIGCFAEGTTEIVNAAIARTKESDRLHAIALELQKMGAHIEERPDGLSITPVPLKGAHMQAHSDHRIAMALSVAALAAYGESVIEGVECIAKTYPNFARDFQQIGAQIEEM